MVLRFATDYRQPEPASRQLPACNQQKTWIESLATMRRHCIAVGYERRVLTDIQHTLVWSPEQDERVGRNSTRIVHGRQQQIFVAQSRQVLLIVALADGLQHGCNPGIVDVPAIDDKRGQSALRILLQFRQVLLEQQICPCARDPRGDKPASAHGTPQSVLGFQSVKEMHFAAFRRFSFRASSCG